MNPHLSLTDVSRVFTRKPDLVDRFVQRLGGKPFPVVRAVDRVTLEVGRGEALGLVGESGCGKSTLGRIVSGILPPSSGAVSFDNGARADGRRAHGDRLGIQMVFQDPMSSLNRRKRIVDIIGEAPVYHGLVARKDKADKVAALMREVGLDPSYASRFPHQFSGGQRQRIGIARALAVEPSLLVCDEAVSALDVSVQAQVLNLFMDLRERRGLTYLFISHDLGVVKHLTDRVAVMYLGRIVEIGPTQEIFSRPAHPYTQLLLSEAPRLGRGHKRYRSAASDLPSPLAPPPGCHFHTRCPHAIPACSRSIPLLTAVGPDRKAACHLIEQTRKETP
ncbi:Oligopeptide transport ATP-binding protein OppF [Pigmentiphaga humi]|uniref:Oligopeptide transport ATP-binding protein OppF n=1 Tax=Pigmentiphaga humi TaxID=2478468 RepID=A0A3P4B3R2_9BURK|nr:oligopeptide/dipeptide ABC transporter ATP-binding protein [Pigmentiphaga humi]VCU70947.1 Oligopeptide transport ATP-binding protein OppF [Pigmentiphaga humi]